MLFPPVAQWLISIYGWRTAYGVLGTIILLISVPLASLFLRYPPGSTTQQSEAVPTPPVASAVWSAPFLGIVVALLLFSFATNGLNTHWASLLTDKGATTAQAALVLSVAGFAALSSKIGTGYLLDRFRAGRVAAVLLALCAFGFLLILRTYQWPLAILSAVLVGLGMGAESDVVPYLLTRYFSLDRFGVLYGYTWCVYAVAGATGPLVMGAVFDLTGSYQVVLTVSLAMVLCSSLVFALLPRYQVASNSTQLTN